MMGASIKPIPKPNKAVEIKTISIDDALYINAHAIMCGMLTTIIAVLRPRASPIHPEKQLPSGWQMNARLPNHDDCDGVICRYSFGLCTSSMPVSAGMTIVGKANASPRSKSKKFLMVVATICAKAARQDPASGFTSLMILESESESNFSARLFPARQHFWPIKKYLNASMSIVWQ